MNDKRDLVRFPEQAVKAGQINAMALIHEILHLMIVAYRQQRKPTVLSEAAAYLDENLGEDQVTAALLRFEDEFPALSVYRGEIKPSDYLAARTDQDSNRDVLLEEALLLWLANANPAYSPYLELFDDDDLERETAYRPMIEGLREFFDDQPSFGSGGESLFDLLRAPALASPYSLTGQLEYIRQHWGQYLGKYLYRLLASLDLIAEEEKAIFMGPGPATAPDFSHLGLEVERFSQDLDWMPKVVMLAKNAYVWLDQLSKKHGRHLYRLDQIPDEELDALRDWGFTGLWLIGVWERSKASQRIKQIMGNPDAVASAYSLYDYEVAADLGGYEAYQNLHDRAWQRGIRLASDMVPNHVGIDGRWVMEHPDWFVSLPYSPFPSYSFNGPDLSNDQRVGIFLEDHYYTRSDAAVVFKRVDRWTGDTRYVYHGNDGTSMPWNDTAQLNYLNPEVREGVIQTILHVARMFPIIRFDAAMTLAKKHYQRLWFPEPGSGGDIASRAEHGMTREQFDAAFPEEFWREVVDRVAAEVPDTLLLAEAFWLMEGYFVRTLGMHRVYNSAFMNMLKNEDNAKYRSVIKNTVEFDPEILKRYVNFMNNPDEDTAVAQFGKDDKYFGVCVLLSTMPGLPMFGHGQIEGFTEKYGMEYRRAYWDESADQWLVDRHRREIFPLLHKRYLFAEVGNFLLYDFFAPGGGVNEDVFAYSNRSGDERGLVVVHNKWAEARGWIRSSAAYAVKEPDGGKRLEQRTLGEGLDLPNDYGSFAIFRDQIGGLEYIRNCGRLHEQGMYVELGAFKYQVFLDWRVVQDNEWHQYAHLESYLNGRGVPSIDDALKEIFLAPVHAAFKELVNAATFRRLIDAVREAGDAVDQTLPDELEARLADLYGAVRDFTGGEADVAPAVQETLREAQAVMRLPRLPERISAAGGAAVLPDEYMSSDAEWGTVLGWLFTHRLGQVIDAEEYAEISRSWIDEWLLGRIIAGTLQDLGLGEQAAWQAVGTIKLLATHEDWYDAEAPAGREAYVVLRGLLRESEVQQYIQVNRYQGVLWFNREAYEQLCGWLLLPAAVKALAAEADVATLKAPFQVVRQLLEAGEASGFQVEGLLEAVRQQGGE
jgi:glycosidase